MGNSPTPPGLLERILFEVDRRISSFARSGFLRNATISDGGLTIKGGFLRLLYGAFNLFYVGPISPSLPDGTPQQGFRLRRADGTIALQTRDAFPASDGTLNQALTWYDRAGNAVFADDTDGGQGMALPWVPFVAYLSDSADWPTTSSATFVTKYRAKGVKQQPKLWVETWANAPSPGAVAEVQVLVNGTVLAPAQSSTPGFVSGLNFGPAAVDGSHMSTLTIEVQARVKSGAGPIEVGLGRIEGRQS